MVVFTAFIIEHNGTTNYGPTRPDRSNLGLNPEACRSIWVNELIQQITHANHQQSQGIAQVHSAITELDRMTQQNAALVEESASAAASLSDQAQQLSSNVDRFKFG